MLKLKSSFKNIFLRSKIKDLRSKFSFTLIELLVVIAVISSLSALLLPNYMAARERARDSQRKSDLKQIQKGLELYRQDQIQVAYPATLPTVNDCWSSGGGATCTGTVYMNKFPGDPNTSPAKYYYSVNNTTLTYTLGACLENTADSDRVTCPADFQAVAGYTCTLPKKCYLVIQP